MQHLNYPGPNLNPLPSCVTKAMSASLWPGSVICKMGTVMAPVEMRVSLGVRVPFMKSRTILPQRKLDAFCVCLTAWWGLTVSFACFCSIGPLRQREGGRTDPWAALEPHKGEVTKSHTLLRTAGASYMSRQEDCACSRFLSEHQALARANVLSLFKP